MSLPRRILTLLLLFAAGLACAQEAVDLKDWTPANHVAREKKLVGFAWAMPSPAQLRDHMGDLETAAPYLDGLVFKLPEAPAGQWPPWLPAFDSRAWIEGGR